MTDEVITETPGSLWDTVTSAELSSSVVGEYEARCVYVKNDSPTNDLMEDVSVWVDFNTASPYTDIDIGVGTAAVGDVEQTIANENTLPANILWTFARGEENAQLLGNIAKGLGKSLWIRRHAGPARADASTPSDNYILAFRVKRTSGSGPGPGPGPDPGPDPGLDPFGIRMVYPTNTSTAVSAPFFLNMNNASSDCRFLVDDPISKNADGSYSMGPSARIHMFTSGTSGCARDVIYETTLDTYDHDVWEQRRYMYSPRDWKNMEITGYFKVVSVEATSTDRSLYLYSRTLRHSSNFGGGCSGSAYKGVIYGDNGKLKFHKESFHAGNEPCGDRNIITVDNVTMPRTDNNKWFGMKLMMWNFVNPSGATNVHLELWFDLQANNTWTKYASHDDTGGWYPGTPDPDCPGDTYCGGSQDEIIKWGGPIAEARWDSAYTTVHFKWLSCREIVNPSTSTPTPPPPGDCDIPLPGLP